MAAPPSFWQRLTLLWHRVTLEQWLAIDAEYRTAPPQVTWKGAATLLLVAIVLTLQKYFGGRSTFRTFLADHVQDWPFPGLWGHLYWALGCAVVYFLLPALFVRLVLKEPLRDFGLTARGAWSHFPLYVALFLVVLPFVGLASTTQSFLQRYPFYDNAAQSWTQLLAWELTYGLQFVTLEFFFRGFMLFALARYLGSYAIFVMVIPYTMIHFGKPVAETLGAILAGTTLGTLALRTRSIAGGVVIHIAVAWAMDLLALWQEHQLQPLLHLP